MRSLFASFSSSTSASRACACSNGWRRRMSCAAIEAACGPLRRTMPMPPRPGGVEIAAIVSTIAALISGTFDSVAMARFNCREPKCQHFHLRRALETADITQADEERYDADDAEAAIDEAPVERNAANGSGDEGQWKNTDTGDDSEDEDPFVANRIDERAEESKSNDEVPEGEPVGAVGHEGVVAIRVHNSPVHAAQPDVKSGLGPQWRGGGYVEDPIQGGRFMFQREGGDAAQDEARDEKGEPDSDSSDQPYGIVFEHPCLSRGCILLWSSAPPPPLGILK